MEEGIIYSKSAFKHGFTKADIEWALLHPIRNGLLEDEEEEEMAYMTEEEADALDEELTRNTPRVDFSKPDIFMRQRELLNMLKPAAADYIMTRALATHQTPVQIIGELVGEKITAAV